MGARVHYMRKKSFRTRSNKVRQVRTPGGRLVAHYTPKTTQGPQVGVKTSSKRLGGIPRMRPNDYKRISKHRRTVTRAYGGRYNNLLKYRVKLLKYH